MKVDPRALKENPDRTRQTKSTPQADALLLATIEVVGIVQPPESGGGTYSGPSSFIGWQGRTAI